MSNYVKKIVSDYCVLDTETTGLSAYYDEVIEIGILKVRSGDVTDRYEQLIRPKYEIDGFITSLLASQTKWWRTSRLSKM